MTNEVIKIENLKKYYGKIVGVEDVSLKINKGEIYGFIGPNGAGKSTTIRCIMGLINKNSGNISKRKDSDDDNIFCNNFKINNTLFTPLRSIKGTKTYFGSFDTLEEALIQRDYLISTNWGFPEEEDCE